MSIAFLKPSRDGANGNGYWLDVAIAKFSRGKYCHVEFAFDGDVEFPADLQLHPHSEPGGVVCFSSSPSEGGTRFMRRDIAEPCWDVYPTPAGVNEQVYLKWAMGMRGRGYGWLSIFAFIFTIGFRDTWDQICSEVVLGGLQAQAVYQWVNGSVSPVRLARIVSGAETTADNNGHPVESQADRLTRNGVTERRYTSTEAT